MKTFGDIMIGDVVTAVSGSLSPDSAKHTIKVDCINYHKTGITKDNPSGIVYYGVDIASGDSRVVTERTFICMEEDKARLNI